MMRKTFSGLGEVVASIAANKLAAGQARFKPRAAGAEAPRDAVAAGCRIIADALAVDGFSFAKSGPRYVRKHAGLRLEISVQSDTRNIAGERAAVWIHAVVGSRAIQRWRVERGLGLGSHSYLAGGQIGNLREPHQWLEWNFADPATRAAVAQDAVSAIREIAFPFFARFDDMDAVVSELERSDPFHVDNDVEVALWHRGKESAVKIGNNWLRKDPARIEQYRRNLERYRKEGLPDRHVAFDLAFLAVKEGLDFLAE